MRQYIYVGIGIILTIALFLLFVSPNFGLQAIGTEKDCWMFLEPECVGCASTCAITTCPKSCAILDICYTSLEECQANLVDKTECRATGAKWTEKVGCDPREGEICPQYYCICPPGYSLGENGCIRIIDEILCGSSGGKWINNECLCPENSVGWTENVGCNYISDTEPRICPSVCVPMWQIVHGFVKDDCIFDKCGSGCGTDGVITFNTEAECRGTLGVDCTKEAPPRCKDNELLITKTDDRGCNYYKCEVVKPTKTACYIIENKECKVVSVDGDKCLENQYITEDKCKIDLLGERISVIERFIDWLKSIFVRGGE